MPESSVADSEAALPLWVVDDGHGMNQEGFRQLWRIADSNKEDSRPKRRLPIGQFGIGKLAAYVLARNLTHISRSDGNLLLTTMNFAEIRARQADEPSPMAIELRQVNESDAQWILSDVERRDPSAWNLMFGEKGRVETWTAVALSNFRDMYQKLQTGTLRWVLSTGLPLKSDFGIWMNGERVPSSKEKDAKEIHRVPINDNLPSIGKVTGEAVIYETPLDRGKSEKVGRSYGFFIRVRGRIINLDDDTFGMNPFNHAAWSRFVLEVDADGLREHLLSSREGVRDSDPIRAFRARLHEVFNECRNAYEKWAEKDIENIDIAQMLGSNDAAITRVISPMIRGVRDAFETESESFYIDPPSDVTDDNRSVWVESYESEISDGREIFKEIVFENQNAKDRPIRYDPTARKLAINRGHPFIDKILSVRNKRDAAKLFAYAEVLIEGQLRGQGLDRAASANFLVERDYALRLIAGRMSPPTIRSVLRELNLANQNALNMEIATGMAFQILGFEYERAGGSKSGPDGILYARLGRHNKKLADYTIVYDAKQTATPAVPAARIDFGNLEQFRADYNADFGFFIADAYEGENDENGKVNAKLKQLPGNHATLLKIEHLKRLVRIHCKHGVTLTDVNDLFRNVRLVTEVDEWLDDFENRLVAKGEIPIQALLEWLERERSDSNATPNLAVVRAKQTERLDRFSPEQLAARLKVAENMVGDRYMEVNLTSYEVVMHQKAKDILLALERNTFDLDAEDL